MVLEELLGLVDLFGAQTLRIHEVTKVVMIYKDKNLVFATFQIVTPCFKSFDNS